MKKIGILGGIAWPSTVEYYAGICRLAEERHAMTQSSGATAMPEMVIESLDIARAEAYFGRDDDETSWSSFDDYHRSGLRRLEAAGADFAIVASNTAHHRLTQITRGIDIPILSIVEVAAAACVRIGVERVLILGTLPVMQSAFFRAVFAQHGVQAASPRSTHGQRRIVTTIHALQSGRIDGAAKRIHAVVAETGSERLRGPTAVYLGCTELPLAFPAHAATEVFETGGVRYLNSTALHIRAAFDCAMDGS